MLGNLKLATRKGNYRSGLAWRQRPLVIQHLSRISNWSRRATLHMTNDACMPSSLSKREPFSSSHAYRIDWKARHNVRTVSHGTSNVLHCAPEVVGVEKSDLRGESVYGISLCTPPHGLHNSTPVLINMTVFLYRQEGVKKHRELGVRLYDPEHRARSPAG